MSHKNIRQRLQRFVSTHDPTSDGDDPNTDSANPMIPVRSSAYTFKPGTPKLSLQRFLRFTKEVGIDEREAMRLWKQFGREK
ncbi:hypothetical protein JXA32_07005 [Candidatus Sumerlaeota bacterium]|nr:hypothetical protein [Candidatus Sumerlaeota bacterium]